MKAHKVPKLTIEEYINQELESGVKYEYHDGKIYALAGGTLNHGLISGNIYSEIRSELKDKDAAYLPFNSDVKLHISDTNSYVYPDAMVVCDEIEQATEDKNSITNPVLIIEVLSQSTAEYDRDDKFYLYRQIPSFREYVLIEQKKHVIDVHYKHEHSDLWRITRYEGLDAVIKLSSIELEVPMKDIYYRTTIE